MEKPTHVTHRHPPISHAWIRMSFIDLDARSTVTKTITPILDVHRIQSTQGKLLVHSRNLGPTFWPNPVEYPCFQVD